MAVLVECLSLVPGSVVIEADAAARTVWAHVLGADDEAAIARFRRQCDRLVRDLMAAGVHRVRVEPERALRAGVGTDPRDDPDRSAE
jgi:multicomponent Na+:H+ antiporter subunit E